MFSVYGGNTRSSCLKLSRVRETKHVLAAAERSRRQSLQLISQFVAPAKRQDSVAYPRMC